jgi:M6 family metalloprotease-like protein
MKRFITFFLTLTFMLALQNAWAVPAKPGTTEFIQPSGYTLVISVQGDEFVHWSETADGYTILQDKNGYYVYAQEDAKGNLILSQQVAHNPGDRDAKENAFLNSIAPKLRFNKAQINKSYQKWGGRKGMEKRGGFPTTGDNKLIMILANFNDTDTQFSQDNFDNYMNQDNYDGTGSFKEYYLEVSYGQLNVTTVVTTWVTLPNDHDYYGPDYRWGEFARDAVVAASSQVDYSEFDNDNDGEVDGVAIIHQGRGQEATGNENDIWSHSSSIPYYLNYNGVSVSAYTTQPELGGYSSMASIGVMCHEFGHNLGAPDYYDTDYEESGGDYDGNGNWDVMSGGSYNNNGKTPAHHNPYTKWKYYEWIDPIEINSEQEITMLNSVENSTDFYYYMTPSSDEFWLLENRQEIGFDSYVPGHGLLIFHADESHINYYDWSNEINVGSHHI